MSIDLGNLETEAFNIICTESKFTFERRPFPLKNQRYPDCENRKTKQVILRSFVNLYQDRITFCGGVTASLKKVQCEALCFTDYLMGSDLDFNTMVSAFICIENFTGKEVVGGVVFLSSGKVDEVACVTGVLSGVKAKTLRIGAAAVLYDCKIGEVLFDPQMRQNPLCSRSTFLDKNLTLKGGYAAVDVDLPMVQLVKTKKPNIVSKEICITTKVRIDNLREAEKMARRMRAYLGESLQGLSSDRDRGAFWHFDYRADFAIETTACPVCLESLPEKVVGHHAVARDEPNLLHVLCYSCFDKIRNMPDQTASKKSVPYIECLICRDQIINRGVLFSKNHRLTCRLEEEYARLMGLADLLCLEKLAPPASADTKSFLGCSIL